LQATHGKITASGPNCQNYCEILVVYTQFNNVAAGCVIQPGGLRIGDAYSTTFSPHYKLHPQPPSFHILKRNLWLWFSTLHPTTWCHVTFLQVILVPHSVPGTTLPLSHNPIIF